LNGAGSSNLELYGGGWIPLIFLSPALRASATASSGLGTKAMYLYILRTAPQSDTMYLFTDSGC